MKRGCDLLIWLSHYQDQKIAASFHLAAPTVWWLRGRVCIANPRGSKEGRDHPVMLLRPQAPQGLGDALEYRRVRVLAELLVSNPVSM